MRPNLRHLEIFRLFSRVMNVTETARLLRIAQPSVSQALRELEAQLGLDLVVRGQGPLKLTADARALLESIDGVLDNMHGLQERAARLRGDHDRRVSIATVLPLSAEILPGAIERLRAAAPDAHVRLEAFPSREVAQRVADRVADIGFTFLPVDNPDVVARPLMRTAMVCVLPPGHRLARSALVTPDDLAEDTVITFGAQVRQEFDVRLAFGNPENDARFITTNQSVVSLDLVRRGLGVAVMLPFALTQPRLGELSLVPFRPEIRRVLAAVYLRRQLTPLTRALLAAVRDELRRFGNRMRSRGVMIEAP